MASCSSTWPPAHSSNTWTPHTLTPLPHGLLPLPTVCQWLWKHDPPSSTMPCQETDSTQFTWGLPPNVPWSPLSHPGGSERHHNRPWLHYFPVRIVCPGRRMIVTITARQGLPTIWWTLFASGTRSTSSRLIQYYIYITPTSPASTSFSIIKINLKSMSPVMFIHILYLQANCSIH